MFTNIKKDFKHIIIKIIAFNNHIVIKFVTTCDDIEVLSIASKREVIIENKTLKCFRKDLLNVDT